MGSADTEGEPPELLAVGVGGAAWAHCRLQARAGGQGQQIQACPVWLLFLRGSNPGYPGVPLNFLGQRVSRSKPLWPVEGIRRQRDGGVIVDAPGVRPQA